MRYVAIDIEAIGLKPYGGTIWMLSIFDGKRKPQVIHDCNGLKKLPAEIKATLENPDICKIVHNAEYDLPYIELNLGIRIRNIWDSKLAEEVIQGMKLDFIQMKNERLYAAHSSSLEATLVRYGFPKPNKNVRNNFIDRPKGKPFTKDELKYSADDVLYLPALQQAQEYILTRDSLIELALLENQVAEKIARMRALGIGFDSAIWRNIAYETEKEFKLRMSKLPNTVDNWNSPAQVKKYFFNKGIIINSFDELDDVYTLTKNDTLGDFIKARELSKAVSSYGMSWFTDGFVDADDRIRCNVEQIINTGRNSMSNPNLQQLPSYGRHRQAFVPRKGYVLVGGDFSGQEIGIMSAGAEEEIWIEAALRGDDIHSLTASMLYETEWTAGAEKKCVFPQKCNCSVHSKLRGEAKVLNFMLAYGGGPQKFAEKTKCEMWEAKVIVKRYKKIIPKLTAWLEKNGRDALATGVSYSADPYRRRRVLNGQEAWQVVNQGKNNPIQSAGANMLKLAMASIPWEFDIVLVIHDEIWLEVKKSQAAKALKMMKAVMSKSADYITGIKGLVKVEPRLAINIVKEPCKTKHKINSDRFCVTCGHLIK